MKPLSAEEIAELRRLDARKTPGLTAAEWNATVGAIPRLLDEVERTRALLRRIEWTPVCPVCRMYREAEHAPGCELAALLGGEG